MCRAGPTRKRTAREARPRAGVTRAFGSARVVESWRRVPEPALAPLFQEGWRGFPRRTTGAQGHNSLPPEHVGRRLQFVDSGAEPLEFDAATLRLPTSSLQVTTPPNVDFATECCRRGINDGPGYYPDDLNCDDAPNVDFATECCRRGINDGPGYYPDDLNSMRADEDDDDDDDDDRSKAKQSDASTMASIPFYGDWSRMGHMNS
ncbi:hypothetical protein HPB51_001335 [Rhipicephalus microplus]|uniref:Uncharacterized protein n=1 Tax=Rhipicephalus microplus TaxID=6941 RepID=A0A9J6EVX7_RHIMP|nr:hypothetical protein HPB51_001335 [Rhipicephalus microplus]